jgi:hypothetical protein
MNLLKSPSKDMATCSKIPWFPSKPMMKYLPNIKEHRLISLAVQAELDKAKKGADRATNNGSWPKKAIGALQEAQTRALYRCSPGHEYRNDYLKPGRTRISRIYHLRVT